MTSGFIVLAILNAADAVLTVMWGIFYPELEINPMGRLLLTYNPATLGDLKALLSILILFLAFVARKTALTRNTRLLLSAVTAVYSAAIMFHFVALKALARGAI